MARRVVGAIRARVRQPASDPRVVVGTNTEREGYTTEEVGLTVSRHTALILGSSRASRGRTGPHRENLSDRGEAATAGQAKALIAAADVAFVQGNKAKWLSLAGE